MGCSSSRLDELPAVAHCRRRRKSMDSAVNHFTSFAESHSSYMHSLTSLGQTLLQTLDHFPPRQPIASGAKPDSEAKRDPDRNSDSGHIQFTPSSDDEEEEQRGGSFSFENGPIVCSYGYMNGEVDRLGGGVLVSQSDAPPPPPPPPETSLTWDLMNFFAPYDMSLHYPESYNLSREGGGVVAEEPEIKKVVEVKTLKSDAANVDRKKPTAKDGGERKGETGEKDSSSEAESQRVSKAAVDVLEEVKVQFHKASEAGNGVLKVLKAEADQNCVFQLGNNFFLMLNVLHFDPDQLQFDKNYVHYSSEKANLPSILRKLSIWEHKLYSEVKTEEEMRVRHEDLQRRLKKQDEKGSEAQKVDATQKALMTLTPKMRIAFDMVDRISIVSGKLRDEELWPCLKEFIHELQGMWKGLLDCHKQQAEAIQEAADLHNFPSGGDLTSAQVEAAIQLKIELHSLIKDFCNWIGAQRGYVKSLNKWLQRCLLHEPKELSDSEEPYWPSSLGAPLIFVVCHKWSEAMKKIQEEDAVIEAMQACLATVDQLLRRADANIQQRMIIDVDLEKRVKTMEAKEKEMFRVLEGRKKDVAKTLPEATQGVISARDPSVTDPGNLQPKLKRALESLEALAENFVRVYQNLWADADNHAQETANGN
uniref:Nitrate regulatory gene2 protein n=1 Tax=Kalanchoe fedtschenkoi TaxID=63787 RepID=A0A7N0TQ03_KALFE